MKKLVVPLKTWLWVLVGLVAFQCLISWVFESQFIRLTSLRELSTEHLVQLRNEYEVLEPNIPKVVVIGSSTLARGVECPNEIRTMLVHEKKPQIQVNKIWDSYDPFYKFVEQQKLLKKLIRYKPDLICIQAEMLAIQIPGISDIQAAGIHGQYIKEGGIGVMKNRKGYIYKKLKYLSKVNQELAYCLINGMKAQADVPECTNKDVYLQIDTLNQKRKVRKVKRLVDVEYSFDDLEMLRKEGIKTVIIEVPFPHKVKERIYPPAFIKDLAAINEIYKNRFDIDYWEYTGPPLYYAHYSDGGHLNSKGRQIYTKWLLDEIQTKGMVTE